MPRAISIPLPKFAFFIFFFYAPKIQQKLFCASFETPKIAYIVQIFHWFYDWVNSEDAQTSRRDLTQIFIYSNYLYVVDRHNDFSWRCM